MAEAGEGHKNASGIGVYNFIQNLIKEGKYAWFVDRDNGHFAINWSQAPMLYHSEFRKRTDNISSRKASNNFRSALLNEKKGAKEYPQYQKRNEKGKIIERQFQMPPEKLKSLFGIDMLFTDDGIEQETASVASEACKNSQETSDSSDTGFEEMDISCDDLITTDDPSIGFFTGDIPTQFSDDHDSLLDNTKSDDCYVSSDISTPFEPYKSSEETFNSSGTGFDEALDFSFNDIGTVDIPTDGTSILGNTNSEEISPDPLDIITPFQIFDIPEEELKTPVNDQQGVVEGIFPSAGSIKGGLPFVITLMDNLPEDNTSETYVADFDGVGCVCLEKFSPCALSGSTPASWTPGPVSVTVKTQAGHLLGLTSFLYVDHKVQEVLKQLVEDQALQSLYFTLWSQKYSTNNTGQNQGPFTMQGQGSSMQTKHAQGLEVLRLLVYTAAQTNAQKFIRMIFSTSAGIMIFNTYKDQTPLPEDVARANGHDDLAQYLQDVNTRLSEEGSGDAQANTIDWQELVTAVNKIQIQSFAIGDETDLESDQSEDEDNESDYFGDAETSSCGSFELEAGWSDSDDDDETCTNDGGSKKEPREKSTASLDGASVKIPVAESGNSVEKMNCDESCVSAFVAALNTPCIQDFPFRWDAQEQEKCTDAKGHMRIVKIRLFSRIRRLDDELHEAMDEQMRLLQEAMDKQSTRLREQQISLQQDNQMLKEEMKTRGEKGFLEKIKKIKKIMMFGGLCTQIKALPKGEAEASLKEMNEKHTKEVTALLEKLDVHWDGIERIGASGDKQALHSTEKEKEPVKKLEEFEFPEL